MAVFENRNMKASIDDTQALTCTIETAENLQKYTQYVMKVQRGQFRNNQWKISRRYSEFDKLNNALKLSGINLPLPPKRIYGNMNSKFVEGRRLGLQRYINEILTDPVLSLSLPVKTFFDPENYSQNFLKAALQHVSMGLRSDLQWEIFKSLPDIGWRLRKAYFLIKSKADPKQQQVATWQPFGPDKNDEDNNLQTIMKLLTSIRHPYIAPVIFAYASENGSIVIRNFYGSGSVRDILCKTKPTEPFLKKYAKPKSYSAFPPERIQIYGRQILIALKFLHEKGLSHGHLHSGNVIIVGDICQVIDIENQILGQRFLLRPHLVQLGKINTLENIDVYSFGHLLYEMAFGTRCLTATCDDFPSSCPKELRFVLEAVLTKEACKNGLPSIANLLSHPFFASAANNVKSYLKIPSRLKDSLQLARDQMLLQLMEEQRLIQHNQRLLKVQVLLNSKERKKNRRTESKKQKKFQQGVDAPKQNGRNPTPSAPKLLVSNARSQSSPVINTISQPNAPDKGAIPPPPPPPPPSLPLPAETSDRSALLGSIVAFNKGKLKKASTNDRSILKV